MSNIHDDFYGVNKLVQDNGGIENFRCFIQMRKFVAITPFGFGLASDRGMTWVECKITERRYKISDGYKIEFEPLNNMFARDSFYQCDFKSMVESGFIIIKTSEAQKVKHVQWVERVWNNVYVRHEADVVEG